MEGTDGSVKPVGEGCEKILGEKTEWGSKGIGVQAG